MLRFAGESSRSGARPSVMSGMAFARPTEPLVAVPPRGAAPVRLNQSLEGEVRGAEARALRCLQPGPSSRTGWCR